MRNDWEQLSVLGLLDFMMVTFENLFRNFVKMFIQKYLNVPERNCPVCQSKSADSGQPVLSVLPVLPVCLRRLHDPGPAFTLVRQFWIANQSFLFVWGNSLKLIIVKVCVWQLCVALIYCFWALGARKGGFIFKFIFLCVNLPAIIIWW